MLPFRTFRVEIIKSNRDLLRLITTADFDCLFMYTWKSVRKIFSFSQGLDIKILFLMRIQKKDN